MIEFSHIVSSCANILSECAYESDLTSESVLHNAVWKLPIDLKTKCLTFQQSFNPSFKETWVLNAWLKDIVEVQKSLKLQFESATDKVKFVRKAVKQKFTVLESEAQKSTNQKASECFMWEGEHKIRICQNSRNSQ